MQKRKGIYTCMIRCSKTLMHVSSPKPEAAAIATAAIIDSGIALYTHSLKSRFHES